MKPTARKAAEAFTAEVLDAKREYKLRGRKQPLALNLPPDLIAQVDAVAEREERRRHQSRLQAVRTDMQPGETRLAPSAQRGLPPEGSPSTERRALSASPRSRDVARTDKAARCSPLAITGHFPCMPRLSESVLDRSPRGAALSRPPFRRSP
jgi:hypothetical protein